MDSMMEDSIFDDGDGSDFGSPPVQELMKMTIFLSDIQIVAKSNQIETCESYQTLKSNKACYRREARSQAWH